jgi:hypothetical protein
MLVPTALVAISLLSGCNTAPKQAEVDANGKKIEYVYITPTGSNVPVKIRKDQSQSSDAQTASDQAALLRLQMMNSGQSKQPGGP